MLNIEKIRSTFQRHGHPSNSVIKKQEYFQFLNTLSRGEGYDEDVANELWEQAAGAEDVNQIKVDQICRTIEEGQNILQRRILQIQDEIRNLQRDKTHALNSGQARNSQKVAKIEESIQALYQDRTQYQQDLRLVTEPFGIRIDLTQSAVRGAKSINGSQLGYGLQSGIYPQSTSQDKPQAEQLKWVLYLTLIFGAIEVIIIYGKYDFLNLIVLTCLLSIYLLNHFDQMYIKLTLGLLLISQIMDVIWLFMYAGQTWNPPSVGNNSSYQIGYLRFIVFFTVVIIGIKAPLGFFLFKYRNASPDNKYTLSMGLFKIVLSANKTNPITRGINNNLSS